MTLAAARPLDLEFAFWRGSPLRPADFSALRDRGVHGHLVNWTRGAFEPLLRAAIVFRRRQRFDFARDLRGEAVEAVVAYTLLARDFYGAPVDLVAWHPRSGRVATWFGRTGLLGLDYPCGASSDDPLAVFPDPCAWLAGERRGVVVIDERLARPALLEVGAIRAVDTAHGIVLRSMLQKVRLPSIVVAADREMAAA